VIDRAARDILTSALALALGAAVSLGLARFSYALLLPPMRADLGWSYFTAGAMGTANAAGYLAGALAAPWLMARVGARTACIAGTVAVGLLLMLHGLTRGETELYALRVASGAISAVIFVSGGLMAARLSLRGPPGSGINPGLVLGLYYGGTGWGIVASALIVAPPGTHAMHWASAWQVLGMVSLAAAAVMAWRLRPTPPQPVPGAGKARFDPRPFAFALAAYFMFGLGYIGYMTFIVTFLREQALPAHAATAFFAVLGIGVAISPFLWAGLLQRHPDGRPLARLSLLLALATALPVLWASPVAAYVSGSIFGAVFLSVVAATTALVRHNLPQEQWPAGVSTFTIIFAVGQIIGPGVVGVLADGPGGLRAGLGLSACALLIGAALARAQRAVIPSESQRQTL